MVKKLAPYLGVALAFTAVFAWYQPKFFWGLPHMLTDPIDGILNYWMLSHGMQAINNRDFANFWNGNIFYPFAGTMALSDTLLFQVLFLLPGDWLGSDRLLLYNLSIPLWFAAMGTASFHLARNLTADNKPLSFVVALLATSHAYWFSHLGHYQLLATFWYPVICYLLLRFYQSGQMRYWHYMAWCLLGLALTSPYLFVLFLPALLVMGLALVATGGRWRYLPRLGLYMVAPTILIGWYYLPYIEVKQWYGLNRSLAEQALYSGSWAAYSRPHGLAIYDDFLGKATTINSEGDAFLGSALAGLLVCGLAYYIWSFKNLTTTKKAPRLLILALALLLLTMHLSFGPSHQALGETSVWQLFSWLPGISGVRAPGRMNFQVYMFAAVVIALLWRGQRRFRWLWFLVALWQVIEMRPRVDRAWDISEVRQNLQGFLAFASNSQLNEPLLYLPTENIVDQMLIAAHTQSHLIGGHSGFVPRPTENLILPNLKSCTSTLCLNILNHLGAGLVMIDKRTPAMASAHWLTTYTDATIAYEDPVFIVLRVSAAQPRLFLGDQAFYETFKAPELGGLLSYQLAVAEGSSTLQADLRYITDQDPNSRWTSKREQSPADALVITLGEALPPQLPLHIRILCGSGPQNETDYLRAPIVTAYDSEGQEVKSDLNLSLTSTDGAVWQWLSLRSLEDRGIHKVVVSGRKVQWSHRWWSIYDMQVAAGPKKPASTHSQGRL